MILKFKSLLVLPVLAMLISCSSTDNAPWEPLFTGTDFSEFEQLGGEAGYRAEDGVIIGTSVANTEDSFMATKKIYSDFILEYKVMVDTSLNSGVQIRSNTYLNGCVHGYQVEIDPTPRAYSGGIYEQARRGWLNNLSENEAGRAAFKNHEWNQYRVEAIGGSIKTWINGVMCANLVDECDESGFIAFQVHSINIEKKPWEEGVEVMWKDIRIMTEKLDTYRFQGEDPVPVKVVLLTNQLSEAEEEAGWELLFDGVSTDKWRGAHKDTFPDFDWVVENETIHLKAKGSAESQGAGDIVTKEKFSDFEFSVDFMLTDGANSGIKYYVTEKEKTSGSAIGLEFQLLDDSLHTDANCGKDGNRTLSSLYDLIPAKDKRYKAPGQWNTARIVSKDGLVEHYLNGTKVVEYQRGSEEYRAIVATSKYKDWENFGEAEEGHILLQEHGDEVYFKNIKVRKLNP